VLHNVALCGDVEASEELARGNAEDDEVVEFFDRSLVLARPTTANDAAGGRIP
jgi:hypothetical protein